MAVDTYSGKLSAMQVKNAKPKEKTYKLSDGYGLNLEVRTNGSKYWRLSYRYQQKQKTLAIGVYPIISLADARVETLKAKKLLTQNIDPNINKRQEKAAAGENSFKEVAAQWHAKESGRWSDNHGKRVERTIKLDVLPYLGDMHIKVIRTSDVLHVLRKVEDRGALDVAKRIKQFIRLIFNYAIQLNYTEFNPAESLTNVIKNRKVQHRKAISEEELPRFLKDLDAYQGYELTRYALQFLVYTFVRPGELRSAAWEDFDFEKRLWCIPAEKMKMDEEHIVPLSKQALALLEVIEERTGDYDLVFPGAHNYRKPMSENTLNSAIKKRLGYEATAHGFRTTASTILNEEGFRGDVIERQLAHGERNKVRAAYNRSQYLKERTDMMQWYSDHIDRAKSKATTREGA